MLRIERGAGLFPFLAILSAAFDALYAGRTFALHGIGRYVAKPQKVMRSRVLSARYRESRNGAIHTRRRQILHESGKHCFFSPDFKPVLPENLRESESFRTCYPYCLKVPTELHLGDTTKYMSDL